MRRPVLLMLVLGLAVMAGSSPTAAARRLTDDKPRSPSPSPSPSLAKSSKSPSPSPAVTLRATSPSPSPSVRRGDDDNDGSRSPSPSPRPTKASPSPSVRRGDDDNDGSRSPSPSPRPTTASPSPSVRRGDDDNDGSRSPSPSPRPTNKASPSPGLRRGNRKDDDQGDDNQGDDDRLPPIDCVGSWGSYGTCNSTCGGGVQTATFTVTTPAANGGASCEAADGATRAQACNTQPCPVDCVGSWGSYGTCNSTCGGGVQTATFTVTTPAANGGASCEAADGATRAQACNTQPCPVNCVGSWGSYGTCNTTCGGGVQSATFTVTTPAANGGASCEAADGATRAQTCNTQVCPFLHMCASAVAPGRAFSSPSACYATIRPIALPFNDSNFAYLNLAEVWLFDSAGAQIPREAVNMSMSSALTWGSNPPTLMLAKHCNDGNTSSILKSGPAGNTTIGPGQICHTTGNDPCPWLVAAYDCSRGRLSKVSVYNRYDETVQNLTRKRINFFALDVVMNGSHVHTANFTADGATTPLYDIVVPSPA